MKDFEPSTLWPIGAFEQARQSLGAGRDDRPTLLPTTLMADLRQLHRDPANDDVLEVIAACVRNHEAALLYLCLLYTSPSPRDKRQSRMPSSA